MSHEGPHSIPPSQPGIAASVDISPPISPRTLSPLSVLHSVVAFASAGAASSSSRFCPPLSSACLDYAVSLSRSLHLAAPACLSSPAPPVHRCEGPWLGHATRASRSVAGPPPCLSQVSPPQFAALPLLHPLPLSPSSRPSVQLRHRGLSPPPPPLALFALARALGTLSFSLHCLPGWSVLSTLRAILPLPMRPPPS